MPQERQNLMFGASSAPHRRHFAGSKVFRASSMFTPQLGQNFLSFAGSIALHDGQDVFSSMYSAEIGSVEEDCSCPLKVLSAVTNAETSLEMCSCSTAATVFDFIDVSAGRFIHSSFSADLALLLNLTPQNGQNL